MNWKRALIPALIIAPLVIILARSFGTDPRALPSVLVQQQAPDFVLTDLDGNRIDTQALRGKPLVLNFWSTWCEPCKAEHSLLQDAAQRWGDQVHFFGVVYQDTADNIRRYLEARPTPYPHLVDPEGRVAIEHGVAGVPESFFIDAQGRVVHKQTGVLTRDVINETLRALTGGTP